MPASRLAYAQARVQARFAGRLSDGEWQRLGAVRAYPAYLQELRATALRGWVAGISELSDSHGIEQALRRQFRRRVEEVQGWAPESWRPAVGWVGWLADLPLLQHLLGGEAAPPWASGDFHVRGWLDAAGYLRREALAAAGGGDLLAAGPELGAVWLGAWRRRWPAVGGDARAGLERLVRVLATRAEVLSGAGAVPRPGARLEHLFHGLVLQPGVLFAYLAVMALDLGRLRGELVGRVLFEGGGVAR
jgi:hypothetical protein